MRNARVEALYPDSALNRAFLMQSYFEPHLFYSVTYFEPQLSHAVTYVEPHISHATNFRRQNHAFMIFDTHLQKQNICLTICNEFYALLKKIMQ